MAPTSLIGQKTQTSPYGRDPKIAGYPIKMCEMLSRLNGPACSKSISAQYKNIILAKKQ